MSHIPQILIHQLNYSAINEKSIFHDLSLSFSSKKVGLVGKNGAGKSTLIKLINGELQPTSGSIHVVGSLAYVPQNPILEEDITIMAALGFEKKIQALKRISQGSISLEDYTILNEDWDVENRLEMQLTMFALNHLKSCKLNTLSGGEVTRLLLTKAFVSKPDFLLLDEPTNHLDHMGRKQLYLNIRNWSGGVIIASHDRALLNLMDEILEINALGVSSYGGNYENYVIQKGIENKAKEHDVHDAKKLLQKTKHSLQTTKERHEKKQSYGRALRKSGKIDKMSADSKLGKSQRSQSKMLIKEERLLNYAEKKLGSAMNKLEICEKINVSLPKTHVPNGKIILEIADLSFTHSGTSIPTIKGFNLKMIGPSRIALAGKNGVGKTTLIHLILGQLKAEQGEIKLGTEYINYVDQNANLLNPEISLLDNFLSFNLDATENDAYRNLASFLFRNVSVHKLVKNLSGGEKMRATLACILLSKQAPQLLILDEPTNHLDIASVECMESILECYQGALIVVSHDTVFLEKIGIQKIIYGPFI